MRCVAVFSICIFVTSSSAGAFADGVYNADSTNLVEKVPLYVGRYLVDPIDGPDKTLKIISKSISAENGKEIIITYVYGKTSCGSGGCSLLILEPYKSEFKVIGNVTNIHPPIRILSTQSHGHPDVGVWVQGGGEVNGYDAALVFDGKKYPKDPYTWPSHKISLSKNVGTVIISPNDKGNSLYK